MRIMNKIKLGLLLLLAAFSCNAGIPFGFNPMGSNRESAWTPAELNPIAWYKAESNALDSTGAYNGTWYITTGAYSIGKIGSAFLLSGVNKIYTCTSSTFIPTDGDKITVSVWLYASSISSTTLGNRVFTILKTSSASSFIIACGLDNKLQYFNGQASYDIEEITTNTWYHFVVSNDGSESKIYVNGKYVSTITGALSAGSNAEFANIGSGINANQLFVGKIDDVLIFDRALSQAEITKFNTESVNKNGEAW